MSDSYSVYTHKVVTNEGKELFYVGVTKNIKERWLKCHYVNGSLYPYIQQYGWNNIEHSVIKEGLTKEEAYDIEDEMINEFQLKDCCINKSRSGLRSVNRSEYYRSYLKKEDYYKRYYQAHKEEINARRRKNIEKIRN